MTALDVGSAIVVGLGDSGFAAARALLGRVERVAVTEAREDGVVADRASWLSSKGAEVELGGHDLAHGDVDLAILSPGIPLEADVVKTLRANGVKIWSEIELAYRLGSCRFLAVTGTNGKTTTTSLLAGILREAGIPSEAAGNIGAPLVDAVLALPAHGAAVVEVSSFQLATIEMFRPEVAVILNIAEDHTDWHGSVEAYAEAKARITENQTDADVLLPNADDERAMAIAARSRASVWPFSAESVPPGGIGRRGDAIEWKGREVMRVEEIPLPGVAGLEDAVAAAGAAFAFGADPAAVVRGIGSFHPLGHRLEVVAEMDDVTFIDDSKATNPHATLAAVRGLKDVVLIAGGRSKGMDLSGLAETVPPVTAVVALGEAAGEIRSVFEGLVPVTSVRSMEEAVRVAHQHSSSGGSVLLSPACASLDMYEGYAARGEHFARAVRELIETRGGSRARGNT